MGWLDPAECASASECLEKGNAREAARLLLDSPHREHRATRQLLLQISSILVEEANRTYAQGELAIAWDTIECARRCAALQGDGVILRERIARDRTEAQKDKDWQEARLKRAQVWADQGRLHSAVEQLAALGNHGDARRLQIDLKERLERFERYVRECRENLNREAYGAARKRLIKAEAILPNDPDVLRLTEELQALDPGQGAGLVMAQPPVPIDGRIKGFGLGHYALFILAADVIIGNPRGHGVHVPVLANIHRKHARIRRRHRQYLIQPACSRCEVSVNGHSVNSSQMLHDGDRLELGNESCAWKFRLPVSDSGTAILEPGDVAGSAAWMPDGSKFTSLVLVDEGASIRPNLPAHLVIPELPCSGLTLAWREDRLVAEADGGALSIEAAGQDCTGPIVPLLIPCRLTIQPEMDERDLLGRAFAGLEAAESLTLELTDPYRSTKPIA